MTDTKTTFITIEGVNITFNTDERKVTFHLPNTFAVKEFQEWRKKNAEEILKAITTLGGEVIKKQTGRNSKILPKRKPIYAKEL